MTSRITVAALAAAALALPAAATADPGNGKGPEKKAEHVTGKKQAKTVTYVFKGTFSATGTVTVASGNAHVRRGGYVAQAIDFDFANAKVVGVDANGDQKVDVTDVAEGDKVLVQARLTKGTEYTAPAEGETAEAIVARKLVDRTGTEEDAA